MNSGSYCTRGTILRIPNYETSRSNFQEAMSRNCVFPKKSKTIDSNKNLGSWTPPGKHEWGWTKVRTKACWVWASSSLWTVMAKVCFSTGTSWCQIIGAQIISTISFKTQTDDKVLVQWSSFFKLCICGVKCLSILRCPPNFAILCSVPQESEFPMSLANWHIMSLSNRRQWSLSYSSCNRASNSTCVSYLIALHVGFSALVRSPLPRRPQFDITSSQCPSSQRGRNGMFLYLNTYF